MHRDLMDEDIARIADTYHAWKGDLTPGPSPERRGEYQDVAGFCKSVTIDEIRAQGYVLTPGRYVGAAEVEEDDEPFEVKIARLTKELEAQFEESSRLSGIIREILKSLDYGK